MSEARTNPFEFRTTEGSVFSFLTPTVITPAELYRVLRGGLSQRREKGAAVLANAARRDAARRRGAMGKPKRGVRPLPAAVFR
jgi:hypothetical protein